MSETLMAVLFAVVLIGGPFLLIWLMDRRAKAKGPLFSGPATPRMRVLALLLGIIFAGLFLVELTSSETIHLAFPILAFALLGYSLGAGRLLGTLQGKRRKRCEDTLGPTTASPASEPGLQETAMRPGETELPKRGVPRLLKRLGVVLAVSAVAIFGALWAASHPNEPFSIAFVVGVILLFTLAYVFDRLKLLKGLFELFRSLFR